MRISFCLTKYPGQWGLFFDYPSLMKTKDYNRGDFTNRLSIEYQKKSLSIKTLKHVHNPKTNVYSMTGRTYYLIGKPKNETNS